MKRVIGSARYLADHMHEVPMMIFPCVRGRARDASPGANAGLYGSIIPAAWSLMLALRARGIGAAWTTLHLSYEQECNEVLGIPADYTTAALLPAGYFTGETFRKADRVPAAQLTYWESWGAVIARVASGSNRQFVGASLGSPVSNRQLLGVTIVVARLRYCQLLGRPGRGDCVNRPLMQLLIFGQHTVSPLRL